MRKVTPLRERFERNYMPVTECGCWIWLGSVAGFGYGEIGMGRRGAGKERAHRLSWQLYRGAIPDGMNVLHRCNVSLCCNPDHLYLGTQADNLRDMTQQGRHWRHKQTHCKKGHPLHLGKNQRYCRTCHNARERLMRRLKKESAANV